MYKKRLKSFTLAEVLITLTIIGAIAAITIPNLLKKYQNHAIYTALKKNYSILNNAYKLIEKEYGAYEDWGPVGSKETGKVASKFAENLKYEKICEHEHGCFSPQINGYDIKTLTGDTWRMEDPWNGWYTSIKLSDGTNICFKMFNASYFVNHDVAGRAVGAYKYRWGDNYLPAIFVDVNGNKGPNQIGRDTFVFIVTKSNGLIPAGVDDTSYCSTSASGFAPHGASCTYKVLKEGGIYY